MNEILIINHRNKPLMDSREIAELLGKPHCTTESCTNSISTTVQSGTAHIWEDRDGKSSAQIVAEGNTRLHAIREAKKEGYTVVIKNRAKENSEKKSIMENLAASKKRVASQRTSPQQTLAKSKPSGLVL